MMNQHASWLKRLIFLMIVLLVPSTALAQNEANIWYFGSNAGLDFNSGTPVALTNGQLNTSEGCATINDSNGSLLFYTDGTTVYNRNHQVMVNGAGLNGNSSSAQSAVVVPVIGSATQYYLFTVDQGGGTGLTYSIIDMALGGGLGAVTPIKNLTINGDINTEKIGVARHANGIDFWLLTSKSDGTYYAYQITPAGISPMPTVTSTGVIRGSVEVGYMRVSPDNQSVVAAYFKSNKLDFLDFNNTNGQFTLRARDTGLSQPYGVEFSPDSRFAYVSFTAGGEVRQYDLQATNAALPTSFVSLTSAVPNVGALSLGPDQKIYVSIRFRNFLSTIESPNTAGAGANFQLDSVDLGGRTAQFGLPTFANFIIAPPQVAITTPIDGSSTNDTTPAIEGTAGIANTVDVTIEDSNGAVLETRMLVAGANNGWSFDAMTLADGTYTVRATATNLSGASVDAPPVTFTVDTVDPTLTIAAPTGTIADSTPTLSGTSEADASIVLEIKDNNGNSVEIINTTADAQGNYSVDAMMLADGAYTIEGTATDAAGNTATATGSFTLDTVAIGVTISQPNNNTVTTNDTININGSTKPGATVTLTIKDSNGATVQTITPNVNPAGNFNAMTMQLADGTYTIDALATDNTGMATDGPVTFTIDTTAPNLVITTPADNSTITDSTPTISGSTEIGATVTLVLKDSNGATVETLNPTVDAQGNYSVDAMMLADGTYTIEGSSTDAAGNNATATSSFTVDTVAITVSLSAPANNTTTNDNTPAITGTTKPGATVTLTIKDSNGAIVQTLNPTVDAQGNFNVDAMMLADGAYTIEAAATDNINNATDGPVSITIDTAAPTVSLTAPANNSVTNDNTPTITGATEAGAAVVLVVKDSNGATVQTLNPMVDAQGNFTVDATMLADGAYTIEATSTDAAGNSASAMSAFTVDTIAPAIDITAPVDNTISNMRNVDISGTTDPNEEVTVTITDANNAVVATQMATADANGDWSVTAMGLSNGDYTAEAAVSDLAGNSATDSVTFSVDSNQPTLSITAPADNAVISDNEPALEGVTDADATVTIELKDDQDNVVATDAVTVDAQGNWTSKPSAMLADGTYTLEATATRANGTSITVTSTFTVDTVAPALTLDAPADGSTVEEDKPTISGTSDAGQEVVVTIKDAQDMTIFEGVATTDANGDWSIEPTNALAEGDYTVEATTLDDAGNRASDGPNTFTVSLKQPMVSITTPEEADALTTATPTITGTADANATVDVLIDGAKVGEATADAQGAWSFDVTDALAEGAHTVEAKVTDGNGKEASSGVINFTVELPKAPITITSPAEGAAISGQNVTITGTGEPGEELTVTVGGETQTVVVDDEGNWSLTLDNIEEGQQTITVSAGEMSATVNVTVEAAPNEELILEGGRACSSTNAKPSDSLWLLMLVGLLGLRRRRRG